MKESKLMRESTGKSVGGAIKYLVGMLAIAVAALITFTNSVKADVIFEPEDDFYKKNSSECEICERHYITNGYDGKVIVYQNPKKNKVVEEYENGEKIFVDFTYTDKNGISWGLINTVGWFPMDYAYPVYDNTSFWYEHGAEYVTVPYDEADSDIHEGDDFYLYSYPGAPSGYLHTCYDEIGPDTTTRYTDPFGYEWGYVSYYYANRGWVCLSHPGYTFEELYPDGQSFSGVTEIPEECAYEIIPGKKIDIADNGDTDKDKDKDRDRDNDDKRNVSSDFPWIVVIIAAVILLSVCSAVVILVIIKKMLPRKSSRK